ncbi:MAG: tRNA (adenosine(37)-N6)-threonylcarbamoyltransferase complex dimerization subunit type 1 TsaB [Alphaproteobacteria bacterium]|nr:tRNA (adenosine(37)-N6)-threonylcarbamoyltransferase complex dimerization subunit type 1 TsaB [Alphaproteobacteria bacterium]
MILVIDTTSAGIRLAMRKGATSCAPQGPPLQIQIETDKQSVALPVLVEKFLGDAGATFKGLTAIGVIVGPGSFTGIRLSIAYAKGLSIALGIPVVPVNGFEVYLEHTPDAFVAIDSNRGDFFVAAADSEPTIMSIDDVETEQMKYAKTVGHKPYDLTDALTIVARKLTSEIPPAIPLYIRPHYADTTCKSS